MTQSIQTISPLRQRMIDDMRLRKLSPKTQTGYIRAVRRFAAFLGRAPDTANAEDLNPKGVGDKRLLFSIKVSKRPPHSRRRLNW